MPICHQPYLYIIYMSVDYQGRLYIIYAPLTIKANSSPSLRDEWGGC